MSLLGGLFGGGGGGFSGGGAFNNTSTPTTNNTSTTETISNVDNRVGGDNAVFGGNLSFNPGDIEGAVTLQQTDLGAIAAGTDIALESIRALANSVAGIQSTASDTVSQGFDLANEARQSETSGAINNLVMYAAGVIVIGIIAWAVVRSK